MGNSQILLYLAGILILYCEILQCYLVISYELRYTGLGRSVGVKKEKEWAARKLIKGSVTEAEKGNDGAFLSYLTWLELFSSCLFFFFLGLIFNLFCVQNMYFQGKSVTVRLMELLMANSDFQLKCILIKL